MPSVFMTAVNSLTVRQSPVFFNDADGLECVQFGIPYPTSFSATNLGTVGFNITENLRNTLCQITAFRPQQTLPPLGTVFYPADGNANHGAFGQVAHDVLPGTYRIRVDWAGTGTVPCQYGTEMIDPTRPLLTLTPLVILGVLTTRNTTWLDWLLVALQYGTLDLNSLCGSGPPLLPTIDNSTWFSTLATKFQIFQALAWHSYCRCKPGVPAPIQPTPPAPVEPIGWLERPSIPAVVDCNSGLDEVLRRLSELQIALGQDLNVDTLMQRWRLPFATIPTPTVGPLSGSGSFALNRRLVGITIDLTAQPLTTVLPGSPPYIKDLGWISISDGGAMLQELRVTRDHQSWFPPMMELATTFGYALTAGTEITVTGLQPEP